MKHYSQWSWIYILVISVDLEKSYCEINRYWWKLSITHSTMTNYWVITDIVFIYFWCRLNFIHWSKRFKIICTTFWCYVVKGSQWATFDQGFMLTDTILGGVLQIFGWLMFSVGFRLGSFKFLAYVTTEQF